MQRKNKPKEYPQQQESSGRRSQTVIPYKRGSFCFMTKQCRAFLRRPARRPPLLLLLLLQQQQQQQQHNNNNNNNNNNNYSARVVALKFPKEIKFYNEYYYYFC